MGSHTSIIENQTEKDDPCLTLVRRVGIVKSAISLRKEGGKMACKSGSKSSPCGSKKTTAKKKKK